MSPLKADYDQPAALIFTTHKFRSVALASLACLTFLPFQLIMHMLLVSLIEARATHPTARLWLVPLHSPLHFSVSD